MKKCYYECIWLTLAIMLSLSADAQGISPTNLQCEAKSNPLGLSETSPRLSWQDEASVAGARGRYQTAYQIQVASSLQVLTNNQGDLWDTGQTATNLTAQIAYGGSTLISHQVCYWHVRVWDQSGQPSAWSSPSSWSMGILTTGGWTAQWVGRDDAPAYSLGASTFTQSTWIWYPEGNPAQSVPVGPCWFRKTFVIPSGVSVTSANVTMTCDNEFVLYVNGMYALSGTVWQTPGVTDITGLLAPGTNVLAVWAYNTGTSPNAAGLIGAFNLTYGNGQSTNFQTDGTWITTYTTPASNWYQTNYVAAGWNNALVMGTDGISPWGNVADSSKTYYAATMLRKDFNLSQLPSRAVLYVTGQGVIEPHLNGQKVGNDYFIPGNTDYAIRLYYKSYDVTSLLQPGSNTLGAILGDGWYRGNIHSSAGDLQNNYGTHLRLLAELHMFYPNGTNEVIVSDPSWMAGFGPILKSDEYSGEVYDARRQPTGWDSAGFTNSSWSSVTTGGEHTPVLQAYPEETVQTNQMLPPISITQPQPGLYVLNFGQNITGWACLQISNQPAGNQITMNFGECLNTDGTVYQGNLQIAATSPMQQDTYICKGGGAETWEPRFTFHGFQYVEVQGLTQAPTTNTVTAVVVHSALPGAGSFQCSDPLLNQINSNMLWSLRDNFLDGPMGCPQRDERQYWCDGGIEDMRTALFNLGAESFYSKWEQDIADSAARVAIPDCAQLAPVIVSGAGDSQFSSGWNDVVVFVPYWVYRTYGDTRLAQRFYTNMVEHMNYYANNSTDFIGPVGTYGDWEAVDASTPFQLISTAFYARCASMMSEMAQALGKTSDAAAYGLLFTNICSAFQSDYVAADGTVGSGSEASYALALDFNLLTPAQRVLVTNNLAAAISAQGGHPSTGFEGTRPLLPALTSIGRSDLAYQMVEKTDYPSWGNWVSLGATTMWEAWNAVTSGSVTNGCSPSLSLNHYNLGSCAEWFYRDILGIDQLQPGFAKILISPQMGGGLTWAQGSYDSIQGPITSAWQFTNNIFALNVTIPANTTAEIHVPTTNASAITESGVAAASSPGVTYVGISNNAAVYAVGSGNYIFSSPFAFPVALGPPIVTGSNEQATFPTWVVESPNLIAGQVPGSYIGNPELSASGNPPGNLANLTDGLLGIGTDYASCGGDGVSCASLTYSCTNGGWNITNIVVYTGWSDYGRAGQFYNISYSSLWNTNTFIPLASVVYNPSFNTGTTWATRVAISPPTGQTVLASNVAAVTFDFTPQGTQDYGWSAYTEIVFQGANAPSAIVNPLVLAPPVFSGGNLIVAGTGGTPNGSYTWLTTTNLSSPILWTTNSTGTLDATGAFSNAIPVSATTHARFFRLRLP
jgi:alpha-L-rhamnosidase